MRGLSWKLCFSLSLRLGTGPKSSILGKADAVLQAKKLIKLSVTWGKDTQKFTEFKQSKQSIGFELSDLFLIYFLSYAASYLIGQGVGL